MLGVLLMSWLPMLMQLKLVLSAYGSPIFLFQACTFFYFSDWRVLGPLKPGVSPTCKGRVWEKFSFKRRVRLLSVYWEMLPMVTAYLAGFLGRKMWKFLYYNLDLDANGSKKLDRTGSSRSLWWVRRRLCPSLPQSGRKNLKGIFWKMKNSYRRSHNRRSYRWSWSELWPVISLQT